MRLVTRIGILLQLALTACSFPRPDNAEIVRGEVRGLWTGTEGVALRLRADEGDQLLMVSEDGEFSFPDQLSEGTSYSVIIDNNPAWHTCTLEGPGDHGRITGTDQSHISIACTGPEVTMALSGPWDWTFDPSQTTQSFLGSIIIQDVALTVDGATLTSVSVDHAPATLGERTPPIELPLGSRTVAVELTAAGGLSKTYSLEFNRGGSVIEQIAYGKASNTDSEDQFGQRLVLDGDTLAIAAPFEASRSAGINVTQADNGAERAGAVYVFVRNGAIWRQQAYIKASNTGADDRFGSSIALSGNTLVVGAIGESSNATGINGNQADDSERSAGAVYVFVRNDSTWSQQAYIKSSPAKSGRQFGSSVAISGDTLAIGENLADVYPAVSGAVHVFVRNGTTWSLQAFLTTASRISTPDTPYVGVFLTTVALFGDTLAIPAGEVSAVDGSNGRGGVYVFVRNGTAWKQQAYLTGASEGTIDGFGSAVSLYADKLAIGAPFVSQGNPDPVVYVFTRTGTIWTKQAKFTGSNTGSDDSFGTAIALWGDQLAVGASTQDGAASGVNGDQGDGAGNSGAVYVFSREGISWTQRAYIKASNTGIDDFFGNAIALSADTLVVGASGEASAATGVNPKDGQTDNGAVRAGAFYMFR